MIANSLADRIAENILSMRYIDPQWQLRIAFGPPGARTVRGRRLSGVGPGGYRGRRPTILTLTVRPDWLETVWEPQLAIQPDPVAGSLLVLDAQRQECEGAEGAWHFLCCYQHGETKVKTCNLYTVRYAGRLWTSDDSIADCMRQVTQSVEVALGLAEEPLPF